MTLELKTPHALEPVEITARLVVYDAETNTGCVVIEDGKGQVPYFLKALPGDDECESCGFALVTLGTNGKRRTHHIDTTGRHPTCDCPDRTFQPDRPMGCRHLRAMADLGFVKPIPMPPTEQTHDA